MQFDNTPGSPDGPPAPKQKTTLDKVGEVLAGLLGVAVVGALIVGLVWVMAWMIDNFPL